MNEEVLEPVLKEILEELKLLREDKQRHELMLHELHTEIKAMADKVSRQRIDSFQLQMNEIKERIDLGIGHLENILRSYPAHTKQIRILLFPEYDTLRYYKIVFGRVLMWTTVVLALTYLYFWAKEVSTANNVKPVITNSTRVMHNR